MKIPGDKCVGELKEMMPRNVSCDATVNNDEWNLHVVNDTYSARVGQSIMLEVQVGLQANILTLCKEYNYLYRTKSTYLIFFVDNANTFF